MEFLQSNTRRIVVKVGTNTLAREDGSIHSERLASLAKQIATLKNEGFELVLVSSGAVGLGMARLHLDKRPTELEALQACAAIGQTYLMNQWQSEFAKEGIEVAQVLLTREDVRGRKRHLAVRKTLDHLLKRGVIPIVNENDTVSAAEIKFGDNDVLSALTASLLKAELLVILSTIPGFLDFEQGGALIPVIETITPEIEAKAGGSLNDRSTGGMITKLEAAKVATRSGCGVFIGNGAHPTLLTDLLQGQTEGTFFIPQKIPMLAKKRWLAFFEKPIGKAVIDEGAESAITHRGSSLLAKGVVAIEGEFPQDGLLEIVSTSGKVLARGMAEQSSDMLKTWVGLDSKEIKTQHPTVKRTEVIHRNRLVLL